MPEPFRHHRPRHQVATSSRSGSLWGRLAVLALLPFVGYTLYMVTEKSVQTYRLRHEAALIRAEIEAEKLENLRLQQDLIDARSDARIEEAARRQLNLVKPGDHAVAVVGTTPPTPTPRTVARPVVAENLPAWLAWLLERLGM